MHCRRRTRGQQNRTRRRTRGKLFTFDSRDVYNPHIEQTQPLPASYGYLPSGYYGVQKLQLLTAPTM